MNKVEKKYINVELDSLIPYDNNNKKHGDNVQRISSSIKRNTYVEPIVVDENMVIIAGHGRRLSLMELGEEKVDVLMVTGLSEKQKADLRISSNRMSELSRWDMDAVESEIEKFSLEELKIDFPDIDFGGGYEEEGQDEVPYMDDVEIIVERGDVFQLGEHKIGCMDATDFTQLDELFGEEKLDMVFTDPPYNTGMSEKSNSDSTRLNHMFDDNYTDAERDEFMHKFTASYDYLMKDDTVAYICLDWRRNHELIPHIKNYFHLSNIIIWDKVVHGLGSDYKYTYEIINVCKKGKPKLDTHQGDREYSDVWHIQRKMGKDEDHATKKPLELVERGIRHASNRGDKVGDLFLGSGSTLLACEKHNRVCYGTERDPKYIQVIIKRYYDYTKGEKEIKCINRPELDLSPILEDA